MSWLIAIPCLLSLPAAAQNRDFGDTAAGDTAAAQPTAELPVRIAGTVTDANRQPISGAIVHAAWLDELLADSVQTYLAITDPKGRYQVELPRPTEANHSKVAFVGVHPTGKALATAFCYDATKQTLAKINFSIADATEMKIQVQDEKGQPVVGASLVGLVTEGPGSHGSTISTARLKRVMRIAVPSTNEGGVMTIDWLPVGSYQVVIEHSRFARESSFVEANKTAANNVVLHENREIEVRIQGTPPMVVEDASVSVLRSGSRFVQSVAIDDSGKGFFRLRKREQATLGIEHPSLVSSPPTHSLFESHGKSVYEFMLVQTGQLSGRVVDAKSGAAVADVRIMVADPKHETIVASGRTDDEGRYHIACPAIDCEVLLDRGDNWQSNQRFKISFDGKLQAAAPTFQVSPRGPIIGTVVDSQGRPAGGVMVTHPWRAGGEPRLADQSGKFEFPRSAFSRVGVDALLAIDMESGDAGVAVVVPPNVAAKSRARLPYTDGKSRNALEASHRLKIELKPTCSVSGKVVDGNGSPAPGATVSLAMNIRHGRGKTVFVHQFVTTANRRGSFQFSGLIPGVEYQASTTSERRDKAGNRIFIADDGITIDPLVEDKRRPLRSRRIPTGARHEQTVTPKLMCQKWFNSEALDLGQLKGRTIVLNFWGTWCGPCKAKLPIHRELHELFQDRGLVVIGVHTGFNYEPDAVERVIEEHGLEYPIAVDRGQGQTVAAFGVRSYPTTMMIDRDGRFLGEVSWQAMLTEISRGIRDSAPKQ